MRLPPTVTMRDQLTVVPPMLLLRTVGKLRPEASKEVLPTLSVPLLKAVLMSVRSERAI